MSTERIPFRVTRLRAVVSDGVPVEWLGRRMSSGPLTIELDESRGESRGELNYGSREARAEFRVHMHFADFTRALLDLGASGDCARPIEAVLHSQGPILDDHSFAMSGKVCVADHALLNWEDAHASVLPGH